MKISIPFLGLFIAVFFTLSASSEGAVLSNTCKHIDPGDKVKLGECLFNKETFKGNGRTCASCHPPENNFTIDPKFIETLPAKDKLFVFEDLAHFPGLKMCRAPGQTPNEINSPNGTNCRSDADCTGAAKCESLENGVLMRKYGLILENVDGLNEEGRMRSVPHTLSLNTSLTGAAFQGFGIPEGKGHATGWSGDGTPGTLSNPPGGPGTGPYTGFCSNNSALMCQGVDHAAASAVCGGGNECNGFGADGSLKAFAIGATIQHFPKSLLREIGSDFRLPTEEELEAMEAYQLAQGRQTDIGDLSLIEYKNAFVNEGRDQFFAPENRCNFCHNNAGANVPVSASGTNLNFDTGVESMGASPHFMEMVGAPVDGGFGGGKGNGQFNSPPLIEAADTAPFFHNNSVNTLEQAVAFYNSSNFGTSAAAAPPGPPLPPVKMSPDTVSAIAAFLRTINSLENIRLATGILVKAKQEGCSSKTVSLALADTEDAYQVLEGTEYKLYGNAVKLLKEAYNVGKSIKGHNSIFAPFGGPGGFFGHKGGKCSRRDSKKIKKAIAKLEQARALIVAP